MFTTLFKTLFSQRAAALLAVALSAGLIAPAQAADIAAGAEKAKQVCSACHGLDGLGVAAFPDYPRLAGQHVEYLRQALGQYQSGARKNPIMGGMAKPLTVDEIDNVTAYFASLPGPLKVIR